MIIFLIGLPGVGKSTIGKKLATHFNYSFLDLDSQIEKPTNQSISEIFNKKGENYFREIEQNELSKTLKLADVVIATGGGTPCFFDNMELMNQHGITIYLHALPNEIRSRFTASELAKRPLLKNEVGELVNLFKARKVYYEKAIIHISPFEDDFFEKLIENVSSK